MKSIPVIAFTAAALGIGAGYIAYKNADREKLNRFGYDTGDAAIRTLVRGIASIFPEGNRQLKQDYISENFYEGSETFIDKPKARAKWSLGYSAASILPQNIKDKKYYVAGYLAYPPNEVEGILDDQCVRAIAVDDGSGRGINIFCVIDCVGISNTDIRRIRARLTTFAKEHNIVSINVSATHCHSAIDTQGLWGDIFPGAVIDNFKSLRNGKSDNLKSGRDPQFMENLYIKAADVIKKAVNTMKKGKLYSATSDEKNYSRDKRPPYIVDRNLTTLRFAPDDGSRETVAVFMAAHPVSLGYRNRMVSSDYPYYLVEELSKNGYNALFFQGAQLAVAKSHDEVISEELNKREIEGYIKYGIGMAQYVMSLIGSDKEKAVAPILNVRIQEVFIPAENEILMFVGKAGLVSNRILKAGKGKTDLVFVSEVGYAQVGDNLRIAMVPGEFATELLLGGAYGKEESYHKAPWDMPALVDLVKPGSTLAVIGLCNDSIGYILPDNDYGSILAPLHYEESVSAGPHAGKVIVQAFKDIVDKTSK